MAKSAVAQRFGSQGAGVAAGDLGRSVFGLAAIAFGAFDLAYTATAHAHTVLHDAVIYASAAGQIFGGIVVQRKAAARLGSALLLAAYALYCLLLIPAVIATPLVFDPWGNLFEPATMAAAALVLFGRRTAAAQAGWLLFTLCVITFAVYQAVHVQYTASLVPKWIPPGQVFWVIVTTIAFALAAIALLVRRLDVLATRLLAAMLLLFQVLIWIPAVIAQPRSAGMWSENVLNFAIAASCWVLADFLSTRS